MIKRLTCKHRWTYIDTIRYDFSFFNFSQYQIYGCSECGRIKKMNEADLRKWAFKRKMKGDTFDDE